MENNQKLENNSEKLFAIPKEQFFEDFKKVVDLTTGNYKYVFQFPIVLPFYIPTDLYMTAEDKDN